MVTAQTTTGFTFSLLFSITALSEKSENMAASLMQLCADVEELDSSSSDEKESYEDSDWVMWSYTYDEFGKESSQSDNSA